ncbi:MAG: preprotein translocase subunit SecG [Candidatus Latescibacteria bacterium]|nr:preprotein translocase subunit SecG [Candidatus Latescibacterota bacterium]
MLYSFLLFIHISVSIVLIVSVLLQSSKGGGLAGTFGGSGMTGGVFGGRGAAPFLIKITTTCAILFMVTSLTLNFVSSKTKSDSVLERTMMQSAPGSSPAVTDEMPLVPQSPDSGGQAGSAPAADNGGAADQGGGK